MQYEKENNLTKIVKAIAESSASHKSKAIS